MKYEKTSWSNRGVCMVKVNRTENKQLYLDRINWKYYQNGPWSYCFSSRYSPIEFFSGEHEKDLFSQIKFIVVYEFGPCFCNTTPDRTKYTFHYKSVFFLSSPRRCRFTKMSIITNLIQSKANIYNWYR